MQTTIPTLLMIPPAGGPARAERWMAGARLAAARDLIDRLKSVRKADPVYILAAETTDREILRQHAGVVLDPHELPFHFGRALCRMIPEGAERIAYFGGASAPLLTKDALERIYTNGLDAEPYTAHVNNWHSSDWLLMTQPENLEPLAIELPKDNALGWVLQHSGGYSVSAEEPSAATRGDIDTPADVCMIAAHPDAGDHLRTFIHANPVDLQQRCGAVLEVLKTPAASLAMIGRTSADAWQRLVQASKIWVRVFAEERGMAASGRMERGEVRSILAAAIEVMGERAFMHELEQTADAVLWDTRVWMAHHHIWPADADRFAADLGWVDQIQDAELRRLTEAQSSISIPMVCGGHGVVSGGLYAMLETIAYQPSR
ncbi:MAG: hypothetical protein JXA97_05220 [Anaerolineales bacterium]|nr:hypothetical protein [Anaerolineales bacterium]